MTMSRDTAYQALFDKLDVLRQDGLLKVTGRRAVMLDGANDADLPALYLMVGDQIYAQGREGMPARRTLTATVLLYVSAPDPDSAPGPAVNVLLDAVDGAIAPDWSGHQTLGGIVSHCWIEGTVRVFEGALGQRAAAVIPVHMLVP